MLAGMTVLPAVCLLAVYISLTASVVMLQGHNAFVRKNLNHTTFSAEAGNLYNKHSYKHSGAWQQRAAVSMQAKGSAGEAAQGKELTHSWLVSQLSDQSAADCLSGQQGSWQLQQSRRRGQFWCQARTFSFSNHPTTAKFVVDYSISSSCELRTTPPL
jgi:hypothetical protein